MLTESSNPRSKRKPPNAVLGTSFGSAFEQRDPIPPTLLSHHLGLKETPSGEFRVYRASIRLL